MKLKTLVHDLSTKVASAPKRATARLIPDDIDVVYHLLGFDLLMPSPRHGLMSRSLYVDGVWEPEATDLVRSIVAHDMVVLDIGAHRGYYSMLFASLARTVVCFEINQDALVGLRTNIALNGFDNVEVVEKGVFSSSGTFSFDHDHIDASEHAIGEKVQCVCLDDLYGDPEPRIDLIKLDVEGAELDILKGARKVLERDHPLLLAEVHASKLPSYGYTTSDFMDLVTSFGYECTPLDHPVVDFDRHENVTVLCR